MADIPKGTRKAFPNQIHKFVLDPAAAKQQVEMTANARIMTVQAQNNELVIWAMISTADPRKEMRTIHVVMTGEDFLNEVPVQYIGTAQLDNGGYVVHVFAE